MPRKRAKNFRQELSAGAILFQQTPGGRKYLLLEYASEKEYWGFPKGVVELAEDPRDAMLREIKEETGLEAAECVEGFEEKARYFFRQGDTLVSKEVVYFLCRAASSLVQLSYEHKGFAWLEYAGAREKLTYNKEILDKAESYLNSIYDK